MVSTRSKVRSVRGWNVVGTVEQTALKEEALRSCTEGAVYLPASGVSVRD